jgi:transposase
MSPGTRIDYKRLRELSPEAAREAVLQYLWTDGGNKADAARVFCINRPVVCDILKKQAEGDLRDRSQEPKHQPNKTPPETEEQVVKAKNTTGKGYRPVSNDLRKYEGIVVAPVTVRNILRRNRHLVTRSAPARRRKREKGEFVAWHSAKAFEMVQMDLKAAK